MNKYCLLNSCTKIGDSKGSKKYKYNWYKDDQVENIRQLRTYNSIVNNVNTSFLRRFLGYLGLSGLL